jgi:hypothetical protein
MDGVCVSIWILRLTCQYPPCQDGSEITAISLILSSALRANPLICIERHHSIAFQSGAKGYVVGMRHAAESLGRRAETFPLWAGGVSNPLSQTKKGRSTNRSATGLLFGTSIAIAPTRRRDRPSQRSSLVHRRGRVCRGGEAVNS